MSGVIIDGVSVQGYARAGLSPAGAPDASVVPTLTLAAAVLDALPVEPWTSNEEAADGVLDDAHTVRDIAGNAPVAYTLLTALSGINGGVALVNNGEAQVDIVSAVSNLQTALIELDARFPNAGIVPPPYTGMTATLGVYCEQAATMLNGALLDGEPPPVLWTLQLLLERMEELTDIVSDLRSGLGAIYPNPLDPVDPATASLDSVVTAIIAALTPP